MFIKELLNESSGVQEKLQDFLRSLSAQDVQDVLVDSGFIGAKVNKAQFTKFISNGSAVYQAEFIGMDDVPESEHKSELHVYIKNNKITADVLMLPTAKKLMKRD